MHPVYDNAILVTRFFIIYRKQNIIIYRLAIAKPSYQRSHLISSDSITGDCNIEVNTEGAEHINLTGTITQILGE